MWTKLTRRLPWLASYQCKIWCSCVLLLLLVVVNVVNGMLHLIWFVWGQLPISFVLGYVAGRLIAAASRQQHYEYRRAAGLECDSCKP